MAETMAELTKNFKSFKNKQEAYEAGYWQANRDMWLLMMEVANSNAQNIQECVRQLIEHCKQING